MKTREFLASIPGCWHSFFMDNHKSISTNEKSHTINMNRNFYGTFAEIGAGQEIARWFFKVGGASGTIAKAISAYDMTFSDAIYGPEPSGRYVVESRLRKMIDYEYDLLQERIKPEYKKSKQLFSLANTIAARSPKYKGDCHGWIGIKFQCTPEGEANEIILHIRLLDPSNVQQQEAVGVLGVNLVYAAFHYTQDVSKLIRSLIDGDLKDRIQVNVVKLAGPVFKGEDIHCANLRLLEHNLSPAVLIRADGQISHLAEELFGRQVLLHRAAFNPITTSDLEMLLSARNHFCGSKTEGDCSPFLVSEIVVEKNFEASTLDNLVHRIRMLLLAKQNILITQFKESYLMTEYCARFTKEPIHFVYPSKKLIDFFETSDLHSLESISRIFKDQTRMYFYPTPTGVVDSQFLKNPKFPYLTLQTYSPSDKNKFLFQHLLQNEYLEDIKDHHCEPDLLISDQKLQGMIKSNDKDWKKFVPSEIAEYIIQKKLYSL